MQQKKGKNSVNLNYHKIKGEPLTPPEGTELYVDSIKKSIEAFNTRSINKSATGYPLSAWKPSSYIDSVIGFSVDESNSFIERIRTLLENTKYPLSIIKSKSDAGNPYYLKASTEISRMSFNAIIEIVNNSQKVDIKGYLCQNQEFKQMMRKCYETIGLIDKLDKSQNYDYYYKQDREKIRKFCVQLGIINDLGGSGEGCAITLFTILAAAAMGIYCIISIL